MAPPPSLSAQEYQALVVDLCHLAHQQESLRPRRHHERHIVVLGGIVLETVETAEASLKLMDAGLHSASAPLVRKVLEFGIVAQWLQVTGNSLDAYWRVSDTSRRGLLTQAGKAALDVPQELLEDFKRDRPQWVSEADVLRRFEQVCSSFEGGASLYLMYRSLSQSVHPLMGAISRWMKDEPEHPFGLVFERPAEGPDATLLYTLAVGLLWAMRALDIRVHGRPQQAKIKAVARRIGVPSQLRPA